MRRVEPAGLVGRDAELGLVQTAAGRVAAASGHGLLIIGEAGIGKTRLAETLVEEAEGRFTVAMEAASELETDLPFAPLVRALGLRSSSSDPHAAALGELLEDPGDDAELWRLRMIEGIADLVERRALSGPVMLVVEDLHWADEATLQTLDRLTRRLDHVGVLIVGTARPHPRPAGLHALQATLARVAGTVVDLAPLDVDATVELARQMLTAEPGPHLTAAIGRAGGNPLYVTELLGAAGPQLDRHGDVVDLPVPGVPETVRLAILRNLTSLPEPTVQVLRVASVLGTRFHLRHLALTLGRGEPDVLDALAPALAAGVVADADDRLAFRHDLVRDAVYDDQPAPLRAARHRQVVERLRAGGVPAGDLVPHLQRGDWQGVPEAAEWLAEAGRALRGRSLPVAVDLLTRAVELHAGDQADPHLRLDLAEALAAGGRPDEATSVLQPLLAIPVTRLTQAIRDRLVLFTGPFLSATAPIESRELLATLERAGLSPRGQAQADAIRSWLAWTAGRHEEADDLATRALAGAADTDEHTAIALAGNILVRIAESRGDFAQATVHARAMLERARAAPGQPELAAAASAVLAIVLGNDSAGEADRVIAEGLALADRTGVEPWRASLEAVAAVNAQRRGDWHDAAARYEAALGDFGGGGLVGSTWAAIFGRAAVLNVHRDELELAADRITTAKNLAARVRDGGQEPEELSWTFIADAELLLALGDADGAMGAIRELGAFTEARGTGVFHVINLPYVTAIALHAGDGEEARAAVERAEAWLDAHGEPDPHAGGLARWGRARVDVDAETLDDLVAWSDEPRPLWEWRPRVREDAGLALAAAGERERAVRRLQEALELWEAAGARRDAARVRQALRDLGVRRGRGLAADRPTTGWASLTDAERRVVTLVGEGLTYREIAERLFISRRTVETHVAHVFRKLEVSSRRDLAALLNDEEARRHLAERREAAPQP